MDDFALNHIYVRGEVSNCKYHSSGHIYFTLKDRGGAIACVMFAGNRKGLNFRMTEGMVQDFVKDLLNSIRERGIDTKAAYTVFIGGGAKLLSHFLEQSDRLGKYIFIEDISANAKGYDRLFQIM